jgi:hypothetical protein
MYIINATPGLRFIVPDDTALDTLNDLGVPLPNDLCGPQQIYVVSVVRPSGRSYKLRFLCRPRRLKTVVATLQRFHEAYYGPGVRLENPHIETDADWWKRDS